MELNRNLNWRSSRATRNPRTFLDRLPLEAQRDLRSIQVALTRGANVVLFSEKDESRGLFIVLEGELRISIASSEGRRLGLKIGRTGDILGLGAVVSGTPYDVTAETLYTAKLGFIDRETFTRFLARYPQVYPIITEELNRNFNMVCEQLRNVALSSTAPKKLAWLLLEWSENDQASGSSRVRFTLKHEEIGEFIGATRETVSRTLRKFKLHNLIAFQGSTLTIPNRAALESVACS
jgi:CRP/FNR family cyclic AMP-dependent transcriptional regulator